MTTELPTCAGTCGRPIRPKGTTSADFPEIRTMLARAIGMCNTCYSRVAPVRDRPQECIHCEVPMRPHCAPESDYPGTDAHHGKGLCNACWKRMKRGAPPRTKEDRLAWKAHGKRAAVKPEPVPEVMSEPTDPGVLKLMRERRARQAKQEQMRRVMVEAEARRREFIASRRAA